MGLVGPAYDNVAECYIYKFTCLGKGNNILDCTIDKNEKDKVHYHGDYKVYSLEGYSLNPQQVSYKLNYQQNMKKFRISVLSIIIIVVIFSFVIYIIRLRNRSGFKLLRINENAYMTDDYLYR